MVSSPGEVPDLATSPEVLTWIWMFSGGVVEGRVDRPALSWLAFLMLSTLLTHQRFGISEASGLHLSEKVRKFLYSS